MARATIIIVPTGTAAEAVGRKKWIVIILSINYFGN